VCISTSVLVRFAILALSLVPVVLGQNSNGADRLAPSPSPAVASTVAQSDANVLDWILELAGPRPSDSPAHPERFNEFLLSTVGPVPLIGEAAGAGIEQWRNTPKEWGQGWGAFGQRFGSNLAYNGIRQAITYGGSVALGEDTRYFASRRSGFWPRARHALVSTFTARHEDGSESFAFSSTAGVIGASAISSVWGPESWKGPDNIAKNAGVSFATTAASNVIREFLPDIFHRPRK
jgi:hypothetical protein